MATIQSTIELYDRFSAPMKNIMNVTSSALPILESVQESLSEAGDTSGLNKVHDAMQNVIDAARQMNEAIEQAGGTVNVDTASASDKLEQLNEQITSTVQAQQKLTDTQVKVEGDTTALENVQNVIQSTVDSEQKLEEKTKEINNTPLTWNSAGGIEVFSTSGVERFEQEVQSTNAMLEKLRQSQQSISATAAATKILPSNAVNDLNTLNGRVQTLQTRIQQIESNPLNMGTAEANSELEQLRTQLNSAIQAQQRLNTAIDGMDVDSANVAYNELSQIVANVEQSVRDNADAQGAFNQKLQDGTTAANSLWNKIKGLAGAYLGLQGISNAMNIADSMAGTTARLSNVSFDGDDTGVDQMTQMVYQAAQSARGSFSDMADVVARFGNNAKDAFSSSAEVVRFAELVQKQMTISGTSTQEASNAMLQLSQALGSGVLRGDELNSIFEQSPALIQRIADYMGVSIGSIRSLASEGELTADIVKNAIMGAGEDIDAQFESMPQTWAQVWQSFKNDALMAFQPVLNKITELASSTAIQEFVSGANGALATLANTASIAVDAIAGIAEFFASSWSIIEPIVAGVVSAIVAYNVAAGIANGVTAISTMAMTAHAVITNTNAAATVAATAAQYGLNSAILSCPVTWIILAVVALIAVFYSVIAAVNKFAGTSISATGLIVGAIATAGALIWNLFVSLYNNCINIIAMFYNQFIGVIEWVLNAANGGFDSFGGAVANLIGQIISWFLSLGQVVTTIIDAIFGTNWTAGLESLKGSVISWGKTENSITLDRMNPEDAYLDRIEYSGAFSAGYSLGEGLESKLSGALSSVTGSSVDYQSMLDGLNDSSAATAANTASTADSASTAASALSDSTEELEYMRDLAEMEVVNRYTTAEITINQSNSNTVNSNMDLDGVTSALTDGIFEAIATATEGVYA